MKLLIALQLCYGTLKHCNKNKLYTPWTIKNAALYLCLYFRQLLTDFRNSFTGTLCEQLAITLLLLAMSCHIVNACLHYRVKCKFKKKNYDGNIHLGKMKNTLDQHCSE